MERYDRKSILEWRVKSGLVALAVLGGLTALLLLIATFK